MMWKNKFFMFFVLTLFCLQTSVIYGYVGSSNITAATVNDTRVDPSSPIAFTVGPIYNGSSTNPVQNGWAVEFDGVLTQNITCPDPNLEHNFTLMGWINPYNIGSWMAITGFDNSHRILLSAAGKMQSDFGTNLESTLSLSANRWTQWAYSWDGTYERIYINGTLDVEDNTLGNTPSWSSNYYIGQYGAVVYPFNGSQGEFLAFNRSLGGGEILYYFNNKVPLDQTELTTWYDFDQNSQDQSGNGLHATLNGPVEYVRGIRGKADIVLDGTGDYVSVSDPGAQVLQNQNFTVTFWIEKLGNQDQHFIDYFANGVGGFYIRNSGNNLRAIVLNAGGTIFSQISNEVLLNDKIFVALSYMDSGASFFRVDDQILNATPTGAISWANVDLNIGRYRAGAGRFVNGSFDEIGFYDEALTQTQVNDIKLGKNIGVSPVLYLDMDGNVLDTSGNGNNGAENGDPEYSNGLANVPVYTSYNGTLVQGGSLVNSTTGIMTYYQDSPATHGNYTAEIYPVTNSVQNATIRGFIVDLYNIDVNALYTEVEAGFRTLLYLNGSSAIDGHQLTNGDTVTVNGVTFTWNTYMGRFEATPTQPTPTIVTYNTLTGLLEATYGITNGNITNTVTVTWTTPSLTLIMPFLRSGDWPGVILQINFILLGETIFWTLLLSGISMGIYNYSGAEVAIAAWIIGWGIFSPVIHGEAVTISLIMIALAGGIYIAKFFLDRRTSV